MGWLKRRRRERYDAMLLYYDMLHANILHYKHLANTPTDPHELTLYLLHTGHFDKAAARRLLDIETPRAE